MGVSLGRGVVRRLGNVKILALQSLWRRALSVNDYWRCDRVDRAPGEGRTHTAARETEKEFLLGLATVTAAEALCTEPSSPKPTISALQPCALPA